MLINDLGFIGHTRHIYSQYFQDKPLERLITAGAKPGHIKYEVLEHCLDALNKNGTPPLYQTIGCLSINGKVVSCGFIRL
jgi:hypothetical protein